MLMRLVGPLLARLRIGRMRDWCRFAYARARSPGTIEAASLPHIDPPFSLRMAPGAKLVIGHNVHFNSGFIGYVEAGGLLEIGDSTLFNANCWVGVISRVSIGSNCLLAPMVTVTDGNHRFGATDTPVWRQGYDIREIEIGDNVWIGGKATVL